MSLSSIRLTRIWITTITAQHDGRCEYEPDCRVYDVRENRERYGRGMLEPREGDERRDQEHVDQHGERRTPEVGLRHLLIRIVCLLEKPLMIRVGLPAERN